MKTHLNDLTRKLFGLLLFLSVFPCRVQAQAPKYVFVFIGDGMSTPQRMSAEDFSRVIGHGPLAMNALPYTGMSRTSSANSLVTDSAAAATAISCGVKTDNGRIGMGSDGTRLQSVAEIAHQTGKKVGIVTTVTICHATPAGFYAHRPSRGMSYQIGLDLIASGFEFFAGGGLGGHANDRKDPQYHGCIYDLAQEAGYQCVTSRLDFDALKPGKQKVWARFAESALPFALDAHENVPTLAEITQKGIQLLDGEKGFFMMIEGGKVDYAGHANDAATNLRDILALDDAVRVAKAFAQTHPEEVLIIVTGDHETGGLSMGFAGTGREITLGLLTNQTCSVEVFSSDFRKRLTNKANHTFDDEIPYLEKAFGFHFAKPGTKENANKGRMLISASERKILMDAFTNDVMFVRKKVVETKAHDIKRVYNFGNAAKRILATKAGVGWATGSHTALPTLTTAVGCGAEKFIGLYENTEIALHLKELLKPGCTGKASPTP